MRYLFANCDLDTQLYTLHRPGRSIRLQPQVFQCLMYLLEHRDRVVSKSELIEQVWPEPYVSDAAFASCLRKVRQVVGDDGKTQYVIQTCRGQGYRLIATVTANSEAHAEAEGGVERSSTSHEGALRLVGRVLGERKVVTLLCCARLHRLSTTTCRGLMRYTPTCKYSMS